MLFFDANHDSYNWFARVKNIEQEPKRSSSLHYIF